MSDAIKPPVDVRTCMVLLLVSCTLKRPQDEARSQLTTPHYVQVRTMTDNRTMTDKRLLWQLVWALSCYTHPS